MSKILKRFFNRRKQQKPFTAWPKEFQIGENEKPLLATMTGEPFQLARIHYHIPSTEAIQRAFLSPVSIGEGMQPSPSWMFSRKCSPAFGRPVNKDREA
jgi:hypothetical protein